MVTETGTNLAYNCATFCVRFVSSRVADLGSIKPKEQRLAPHHLFSLVLA